MMPEKQCLSCNKKLKGRIDKKFCDDYCRNNYNNRQGADVPAVVKNILQALKRNRKILADFLGTEEMVKHPKVKLLDAGFNFTYHTHVYTNKKGNIYHFVFEMGYLLLEGDWVLIVKRE